MEMHVRQSQCCSDSPSQGLEVHLSSRRQYERHGIPCPFSDISVRLTYGNCKGLAKPHELKLPEIAPRHCMFQP